MKIRKIINAVSTYNAYLNKIREYRQKKNVCMGLDDDIGVEELEQKIIKTRKELGKFLNKEV